MILLSGAATNSIFCSCALPLPCSEEMELITVLAITPGWQKGDMPPKDSPLPALIMGLTQSPWKDSHRLQWALDQTPSEHHRDGVYLAFTVLCWGSFSPTTPCPRKQPVERKRAVNVGPPSMLEENSGTAIL